MPKFSIVTAVKDGLNDLQRTFDSLIHQDEKDFEWIVIDSASNDGTVEWLQNLNSNVINLIWLSEPDLGIADAYNKGINKSTSEYIMILNAGDTYDQNLLSMYAEKIKPDVIVCSHARLLSFKGKYVGVFKSRPKLLWRGMHLAHNWCCVPRKMYIQHGGYKLIPHSLDFEWFYRYYHNNGADSFLVLDQVLGSYYLGGHSDRNYINSFKANEKIFIENGMNKFLAALICYAYIFKHGFSRFLTARRKANKGQIRV
jgi:glycosyltransferase involved in cell wall biosynthesis